MEQITALFGKATFHTECGYNNNKMFLKPSEPEQDYIIRLKSHHKLLSHNQWTTATKLHNRGKDKERKAYLSHIKAQITTTFDRYLIMEYFL